MFSSPVRSLNAKNLAKSQSSSHATISRSKNQRFYVAKNHAKRSRCEIRFTTNIIVKLVFCGLNWTLDLSVLNNNNIYLHRFKKTFSK